MVGRAKGIVGDRIENLILDPGLIVDLVSLASERVRDRGIVGVGDGSGPETGVPEVAYLEPGSRHACSSLNRRALSAWHATHWVSPMYGPGSSSRGCSGAYEPAALIAAIASGIARSYSSNPAEQPVRGGIRASIEHFLKERACFGRAFDLEKRPGKHLAIIVRVGAIQA